jgi:uncharacterized SAM-binding protein YcdF (DUF218 family)
MFFFLSKVLLFLLSPFFWMIVAFGFFLFAKKAKWKTIGKWSSIGIFVIFSNSFIFSVFCKMWEVPGTPLNKVEKHDVAIVLGGMFEYNSDIDEISIRRQGDRLFKALSLYKTGKVEKLMISGDSGYLTDRGLHEAKQIKEVLISWGIPETDIITEDVSINTHQNAVETVRILKQSYPHFKDYILVTSGIHMKRSLACFEKEGIICTPFSTDLYSNQSGNYFWDQYLIPSGEVLFLWNRLFKEIAGQFSYSMAGYI